LNTRLSSFSGVEVINKAKKLFCNVGHICNLAIEFNGLVSKRVSRQIGPFYIPFYPLFFFDFFVAPRALKADYLFSFRSTLQHQVSLSNE
jgi:hypothetical protein